MPLCALKSLLDLGGEVLLLSFALEIVLLSVGFACIFGKILLRWVLDLLHEVGDIFFIGNYGYHFLLHPLVHVMEPSADLYVSGILLDEVEHSLKDEIEDRVMFDTLGIFAVTEMAYCF